MHRNSVLPLSRFNLTIPCSRGYQTLLTVKIIAIHQQFAEMAIHYMHFIPNLMALIIKFWSLKSLDGGISWTTPYIIATYNQQISSVNAACTGNEVICWATVNGNTEYLLFSVDGGTTFTTSQLTSPTLVQKVTNDLSCWSFTWDGTNLYLSRSMDFGFTWNLFATIPENGINYITFEGAAYDPNTGDYSFIFTGKLGGLKFATVNSTGGLLDNENNLNNGLVRSAEYNVKIGCEDLINGSTEWLILSSAYNNQAGTIQRIGCRMKNGVRNILWMGKLFRTVRYNGSSGFW